MKRKTCVFCSFIWLFTASAFSQSFAFFQDGVQLPDNAEIEILDAVSDEITGDMLMESGISVKNFSANAIEATMSQSVITPPDAGEISFCFFTCINGNVNRSQTTTLPANSFFIGLHLYFYAIEESYTKATVRYEIFNQQSPEDKATVTITYNYNDHSSGIDYPVLENKIRISQNGKSIAFDRSPEYNGSRLEICKITGQKIALYTLDDTGLFTLPRELEKGLYIFTFRSKKTTLSAHKISIK
jgi:hypothetical protein